MQSIKEDEKELKILERLKSTTKFIRKAIERLPAGTYQFPLDLKINEKKEIIGVGIGRPTREILETNLPMFYETTLNSMKDDKDDNS